MFQVPSVFFYVSSRITILCSIDMLCEMVLLIFFVSFATWKTYSFNLVTSIRNIAGIIYYISLIQFSNDVCEFKGCLANVMRNNLLQFFLISSIVFYNMEKCTLLIWSEQYIFSDIQLKLISLKIRRFQGWQNMPFCCFPIFQYGRSKIICKFFFKLQCI